MSDPALAGAQNRIQGVIRWGLLLLLVAAPLAFGSVHEAAWIPLLIVGAGIGALSWAHGHWARAHGFPVPKVPAAGLLLALHVLVLVQLLPLPPAVLKLVSPGSFAVYDYISLVPLRNWRPIAVSPADTARGFVFLLGMSLLYATAFRDFADERWRRLMAIAVVGTAFVMTLEALWQAASGTPARIYGIWRPVWDWAVFGPYVNKNHFAGYVVMAIPLAMAWTRGALEELRKSWQRQRVGWLALGEPAGSAALRRGAVVLTLIVGVVASRSRGGFMAFALSACAAPLLLKRRRASLLIVVLLATAALATLGPGGLAHGAQRGLQDSRFALWADAIRMVPDFPLLGAGMNGFGAAYGRYQRVWRGEWIGEAHNEYLQALLDLGVLGLLLVGALVYRLLAAATRNAHSGVVGAGLLGSLLASAFHALVDFNWQIPANAATFAVLAGVAMQEPRDRRPRLDPPLGRA